MGNHPGLPGPMPPDPDARDARDARDPDARCPTPMPPGYSAAIGLYPQVNYTVEESVVRFARTAWSAYCDA